MPHRGLLYRHSAETGFPGQATFSRTFKALAGNSPGRWRRGRRSIVVWFAYKHSQCRSINAVAPNSTFDGTLIDRVHVSSSNRAVLADEAFLSGPVLRLMARSAEVVEPIRLEELGDKTASFFKIIAGRSYLSLSTVRPAPQ